MPKRLKKLGIVAAINLILIAVLIAGTELAFGFINDMQDGPWRKKLPVTKIYSEGYSRPHGVFGYRTTANKVSRRIKKLGDEVLADTTYTTNEFGWRRSLPNEKEADDKRQDFVAIFGGSYAAGSAVEDNETLSARFQALAPEYRGYNFANGGWGPQHMLAILESEGDILGISEKRGIAVFVFNYWHLRRLAGAYSVPFGRRFPFYELNADGDVVHRGNFSDGRPVLSWVFNIMEKSEIVRFAGRQRFDFMTPPDIELAAALFKKSCEIFARKFESLGCFVLFYPHGARAVEMAKRFIPFLEKAGVSYFNYAGMFSEAEKLAYSLKVDRHPKAIAYELIAKKLVPDVMRRVGR